MKKLILTLAAILALVGTMVSPMAVMGAANDPTTGVSGTLGEYFTITAPADISWPALTTAGASAINQSLSVETNGDLTNVVIGGSAPNGGKLFNIVTSTTLSPSLEITIPPHVSVSLAALDAPLTDQISLSGTDIKSWSTNTMTIAQPAFAGAVAGTYTTTITFTATFSN